MFTNKTENLDLPQWVGTDKANWDVDLNYAFKQISRTEIMGLITNANPFIRHGIYSVISSSPLSGWY